MIEVLESLKYRSSNDLTNIGVQGNNVLLPPYSQLLINGRYLYSKDYSQSYVIGSSIEDIIDEIYDNTVCFNPIDVQIDYLGNKVYSTLATQKITDFIYIYDKVTIYSIDSIYSALSSKNNYRAFSDSVGTIALFENTTETVSPVNLATTNIQPYNRIVESLILDDIRSSIDHGYNDVNSSYTVNVVNVAATSTSLESHGGKLVVDAQSTTRYQNLTGGYIANLVNGYNQLMFLTPLYATSTQSSTLSTAPYFLSTIESQSVIVDKLGNKVSIDSGWNENIMLSAYHEN